MKKRFYCGLLVVCILLCTIFTACTTTPEPEKYSANSFDYFDTVSVITGYAESEEAFDEIADFVFAELEQYHKLYSIYHRFEGMENLCTINELVDGEHRTVKVDSRIIDLLLYAKDMYAETHGMLNIAMGSVLSLWHDYRTLGMDNPAEAQLPPTEKLKEAAKHTDINKVVIDTENSTVTLTDPQMKLDVGAIAKGYATEQIALSLESKGYSGLVLNFGGNVRTIGTKPDGTPWTVGIENSTGDDYLEYLNLVDASVVTSGSYQRYYTVGDKQYHHIIHPDTLMPAEGYVSVSVVCKDSGLGDTLSTALFCMTQQEGYDLVESFADVEAMWIDPAGNKMVSTGWNNYVKK